MEKINQIFLQRKVQFMSQFYRDIQLDCNIFLKKGEGFTRNIYDFFYKITIGNMDYVHKAALKYVYTNAETYLPYYTNIKHLHFTAPLSEQAKCKKNIDFLFHFIKKDINKHPLFPKLVKETENFFIFNHYNKKDWHPVYHLSKKDGQYLKKNYKNNIEKKGFIITPFYRQMFGSLFRKNKTKQLIMTNISKLEVQVKRPLTVFLHNEKVSSLYRVEKQLFTNRETPLKPFNLGDNTEQTTIIKLY